uniref:Uncharacterized protein n=1 Tax=Ignisphaera aggregans TaxID=334771 RepID=A0A7J2U481_9CREN
MPSKFLRDPMLVASIAIIVSSILYLVFSFLPRPAVSVGINVLEEYVKAVTHLNKSSTAIAKRLAGFVADPGVSIGETYVNKDRIRIYLANITSIYGSQETFFAKVASNYLLIADASIDTLQALQIANRSVDTLKEALSLLAMCRVNDALNRFSVVEEDVTKAIENLSQALDNLQKVNTSLIAENHVPAVNMSRRRIESSLNSLLNAYILMKIAEMYRDEMETLCTNTTTLPIQTLQQLENEIKNVKPTGPLSPDISNTQNTLITLINKAIQQQQGQGGGRESCPCSSQHGGQGQVGQHSEGQGGGAGYAPPESDD